MRIVARGDDIALAQQGGGFRRDGAHQQRQARRRLREIAAHTGEQGRLWIAQQRRQVLQALQAVAQAGKIARARALERDAGADAFDVRAAAQGLMQRRERPETRVADQFRDRCVARRARPAVGQRVVQAVAQPARAHRGGAEIEQGEQGGRRLAAQGFGDLEVAAGHGVEAEILRIALDRHSGDMGEPLVLRLPGVFVERAGGGQRGVAIGGAESGQIARTEHCAKLARRCK